MKRVFNKATVLLLCLIMIFSSVVVAFAADEVGKSGNIVIGSVTASNVTVRWRVVDGVKGYVLYRASAPDSEKWESVGKTSDRTLTDKDVDPGTVYYYKVRAYKLKSGKILDIDKNRIYGEYSKTVKAITKPGKVNNLSAISAEVGSSKISLTWNKSSGAKSHQVYMLDAATGKFKRIANTSKNKYVVKNLEPMTEYQFKVRGYHKLNGIVYGEFSTVLKVKTKPSEVKGFKLDKSTKTSYTLTWTASSELEGYQLAKYDKESNSWKLIAFSGKTETTETKYEVTGLQNGGSDKYKVRGFLTANGERLYSNWSEPLTGGTIPPAPVNFQYAPNTDNGISMTWDYSDHAEGYEIYCREDNGEWKPVGTTKNNHFSHKNLVEKRKYEYKVRPYVGSDDHKIFGNFGEVIALNYTPLEETETVYPDDWDNTGILGYLYDPEAKCFYTADDPWQRNFGYNEVYDESASLVAIVIETARIKFKNYHDKDWMIQLWKGNYGFILYGAEIGIYNKPKEREIEHYDCANDEDMLQMEMVLYERLGILDTGLTHWGEVFRRPYQRQWWHTGFVLGNMMADKRYDTDLRVYAKITMRDYEMLALCEQGFRECVDPATQKLVFEKCGYLEFATKLNVEKNFYTTKGLDIYFYWT